LCNDIYNKINIQKQIKMGCGCKNKNNGGNTTTQQSSAQGQPQQVKNATVQESVKKIVEKYYNKR
jgi:hypothetical protein